MKSYLTYAVAILIATMAVATAAPDNDALMEKENAAWQAFKDKNADAFKKIVSANMTAVYAEGHLRHAEGSGLHGKVGH